MKSSKKLVCYDALVARILTLDLEPGLVLDETEISEKYDLSRTPLREVFQKLSGEGYLHIEENRGAKVSSMDIRSMRTFFQSAPMIYAAMTRLATENATPAQLEQLKATQRDFRQNSEAGDAVAMAINNHAFHRIIGDMSGNAYLMPSLNRLLIDHTRMSQRFYRPNNANEQQLIWKACDQHDEMIAAIEEGKAALAVELTLQHWALSRDRIEEYSRPDPLPIDLGNDASMEARTVKSEPARGNKYAV
jgi:DNA-binding GntR family transcriptional regulator